MKILGMEMFPKQKTDEEYIELIRKIVARSKWFGLLHSVFFAVLLGMHWWIWRLIYSADSPLRDIAGKTESAWLIGVMLGAFAGLQLVLAVLQAMLAAQYFWGHRTERLMLRFHDALQKLHPPIKPIATSDENSP